MFNNKTQGFAFIIISTNNTYFQSFKKKLTMKKNFQLTLLVIFSAIVFVSCNKEHEAVTKVIDVTLKINEVYNYQIPATGDQDDVMQITKVALHALSNTLDFRNNTTSSAFQYTPATDYVGTDEVQVSTAEVHNGNSNHPPHQGGGNCQGGRHHHDEGTTYIFRITIASVVKPG